MSSVWIRKTNVELQEKCDEPGIVQKKRVQRLERLEHLDNMPRELFSTTRNHVKATTCRCLLAFERLVCTSLYISIDQYLATL